MAAAIRDPQLRALAEAVTRGRRLIGTKQVQEQTGVDFRLLAVWYAAGLVPSARKVKGVRVGRYGEWLIEAPDLVTVRQLKAEHEARIQRRNEACPAGHPRTAENVYIEPGSGSRKCRPCRLARARERAA